MISGAVFFLSGSCHECADGMEGDVSRVCQDEPYRRARYLPNAVELGAALTRAALALHDKETV